jgi:hypothetical protein
VADRDRYRNVDLSYHLETYQTSFSQGLQGDGWCNSQSSTQYLPAEPTFATQYRVISPVAKYARSEPNSLSTSSSAFRNATTGQTRSMIPSVGLLTDHSAGLTDSARTFVVKFSHGWLPIGVRERRCSGTTDIPASEIETVPHLYRCQSSTVAKPVGSMHLHETQTTS